MKTNKELNVLKKEVKRLKVKLSALTEEELEQVVSGLSFLEEQLPQKSVIEGTDGSGCRHFSKAVKYASQDAPDTCVYCRFFRNDRCERRMN